jgi:hypothetical protein
MCVACLYEFDRPDRHASIAQAMLKRAGCGSHHSIVAGVKLLMGFFAGQLRRQNCGVPRAKPGGDR